MTLLLGLAPLLPSAAVAQQAEPEDPIGVGLTEEVEVELVLVDFLVLDGQGRNVPGLTVNDFALKVAGRKTPIASVDVDCRPDGPARAAAGDRPSAPPEGAPEGPPREPRRILLVFDYFHIDNVARTLDGALAMLDRWPRGDEIHTVISLGRSVRVEAPPTKDLGDVRWALERMRNDPDLYADNQTSLTAYPFFDRMKALFDLVEETPGRKSVVLFSGSFESGGFLFDPQFNELSGLATTTRTSIYPVDTGGLSTALDTKFGELSELANDAPPRDPLVSRQPAIGGPSELRRLANYTGGRITADTNDLGIAYARAHDDLGCTYTLGFYNDQPRLDRKRRLTIKVKQPNMRVVYPEYYLQRSPEERHKSLFSTATMAPHMFESDSVSTDLFVLGPASASRWRTVMAVAVRLLARPAAGDVELRGFLRKPNGTIVHEFKETIPIEPGEEPQTTAFFRDMDVEPGRYFVSAVVSDPADPTPRAATRSTELVRIPSGAPFLIGPILGRTGDDERDGKPGTPGLGFEPLLVAETRRGDPLQSLTLLCVTGAEGTNEVQQVARRVTTSDGSPVESFDTPAVQLPGQGRTHCQEFLDEVPTASLSPGLYEVSASASTADRRLEGGSVDFTVRPGPE